MNSILNITPRDHQIELIRDIINTDEKIITIKLLTGGGKTLLFYLLSLIHMQDKKFLFTTPQINLTHQTAQEQSHHVGILQGSISKDLHKRIVIATIHTVINRGINTNKFNLKQFDFIIIDEAHQQKPKVQKLLDNLTTHQRVILLSATPYDSKKGTYLPYADNFILGIKYDWQYMRERNYLCPIDYHVTNTLETAGIKRNKEGDYNDKELTKAIKDSGIDIVNTSLQKINRALPTVVVAQNIEFADELAKQYKEEGFRVRAIHSKMEGDSQTELIEALKKDKLDMLVAVNMLKTGVDIKHLGNIVLATKLGSINDFIQTYGRGARVDPRKEKCIFIDIFNTLEEHGHPEEFEPKEEEEKKEKKKKAPKKCSCGSIEFETLFKKGLVVSKCVECGEEDEKPNNKVLECPSCHWVGKSYTKRLNGQDINAHCPECNTFIKTVEQVLPRELILIRASGERLQKELKVNITLSEEELKQLSVFGSEQQLEYVLNLKKRGVTPASKKLVENRVQGFLRAIPHANKQIAHLLEYDKEAIDLAFNLISTNPNAHIGRVINKLKRRKKQKPLTYIKSYINFLSK